MVGSAIVRNLVARAIPMWSFVLMHNLIYATKRPFRLSLNKKSLNKYI